MTGALEKISDDSAQLPLAVHQLCSLLTKRRRRSESAPDNDRVSELLELVKQLLMAPTDATRSHERKEAVMVACRFACDATLEVLHLLLAGESTTEYFCHTDSASNTVLMVCAMQCHAPSLEALIGEEGIPLDLVGQHRNEQGATVLHKLFSDPRKSSRSFTEVRAACIGLLLNAAADAHQLLAAKNKHGNTCLHKAVRQASSTACQPLLNAFVAHSVSVSLANNAAKLGKEGLVKSLLEIEPQAAASVDADGNSALHWAVIGDTVLGSASSSALAASRLSMSTAPARAAIVEALAAAGADVRAENSKGETALHVNQQSSTIGELLLSLGASTDAVDHRGWLPLQHAAAACRLDLVCCILEHMKGRGEDVEHEMLFSAQSIAGEGLLHAAGKSEQYGHALVEHIDFPRLPTEELDRRNQDGEQPLQVACRWNNVSVLEALLTASTETHILGVESGQSALSIAIQDVSVDCIGPMVERLLTVGEGSLPEEVSQALVQARSAEGLSLLHRAAQVGDLRTLSLLVERLGMDPCEAFVSQDGFEDDGSPLHLACRSGQEGACQWLLRVCELLEHWNINDCENYGRCTALHLACEAGSEECVRLLLAVNGIDITISSRAGETAMEAAIGSPECMQLLRKYRQGA